MSESNTKQVTTKVSIRRWRWKIRNRFLGFIVLLLLALLCLISPRSVEYGLNAVGKTS